MVAISITFFIVNKKIVRICMGQENSKIPVMHLMNVTNKSYFDSNLFEN
jgi:hypothetical protein